MNQEEIMQRLQAAVALHNQGELDQAESIYRQVLAVDATNFYALKFLGCLCRLNGFFPEGIELLKNAVQLNPFDENCLVNLGNILGDSGDDAAAIPFFQRAIELRSNFAEARESLGHSLYKEGRYEESEEMLISALHVNPDSLLSWMNLARCLTSQGKYLKAINSYRKAIELKQDCVEVYIQIGALLIKVGAVEEAIACYRKAIEVRPDFWEAYSNLGLLLTNQGKIEEARTLVRDLMNVKVSAIPVLLPFPGMSLVLGMYDRRAKYLSSLVEMACAIRESSDVYSKCRKIIAQAYPALFLSGGLSDENQRQFYSRGYLPQSGIVSESECAEIIDKFSGLSLKNNAALNFVCSKSIMHTVLRSVHEHSGFSHLIYRCEFLLPKYPKDSSVSNAWHYDNEVSVWNSTLLVYLNSQEEFQGATQCVDATQSRQFSESSNYIGLLQQRNDYKQYASGLVEKLDLNPDTLDPPHFTFSPAVAGDGIWFCPSRAMHRGVNPKKGVRHVLSLLLTPLPHNCTWSIDECVEKSAEILLNDTTEKSYGAFPYWVST